MACKLAIFEFVNEDNALEIGDVSRIIGMSDQDRNNDSLDTDTVCKVKWPTKNRRPEVVAAKVLRFSDDRLELKEILDRLLNGDELDEIVTSLDDLGRGRRGKRPTRRIHSYSSDEEREEPQTKTAKKTRVASEQNAQRNLLELLKQKKTNQAQQTTTTRNNTDRNVLALRKEVDQLRYIVVNLQETNQALIETNKSLIETVASLSELPHLVEQLRSSITDSRVIISQPNTPAPAPCTASRPEARVVTVETTFQDSDDSTRDERESPVSSRAIVSQPTTLASPPSTTIRPESSEGSTTEETESSVSSASFAFGLKN